MDNIEIGISKFSNLDSTSCYMISILHILQQIPLFCDYIVTKDFFDRIKNTDENVTFELFRLFKTSLENDNINITPTTFKKVVGQKNDMWLELEHQDSQEFFIFLISTIEEELGKEISYVPNGIIKDKISNNPLFEICAINYLQTNQQKDFSVIKELFIGTLNSNIICKYCKTISPSFESFITLPLSIPIKHDITLYDCLNLLIKDEILDKDNMVNCEICGHKNKSIKKFLFWKTPQILVIQLKRFIFNMYGICTSKNTNNIIYPIDNLDLSKYFHPDSPYKNNSKYELIGINCHIELSNKNINIGHYISIVKNRFNNKWLLFNDSKQPVEVSQLQYGNAYLLFYYKKD
jgi:ubiquitin C-terminal hydrolase